MAEDFRLLLALLTLAQCRKRGGGDASSSRSLCKALADRSPYWQRGPLELLNRLHNASNRPYVYKSQTLALFTSQLTKGSGQSAAKMSSPKRLSKSPAATCVSIDNCLGATYLACSSAIEED